LPSGVSALHRARFRTALSAKVPDALQAREYHFDRRFSTVSTHPEESDMAKDKKAKQDKKPVKKGK